jgi:3-oxoadipate enol-lactonase
MMATLPVNGVELAYDEVGEGHPLLLLHEGIADRRMWDDVLPVFAERFRVVRLDLRGYGETPLPYGPFVYAADAAGLLEALGIERAHLVGVSLGGHVALDLALARPSRVDRLVLAGSGIDGWEHDSELKAAWEEEEAAFERGDLDEAAWISVRTWLDGPTRDDQEVDPRAPQARVRDATSGARPREPRGTRGMADAEQARAAWRRECADACPGR